MAKGDAYQSSFLYICLANFNGGMQYLDTYVGLSLADIEAE